MTGLNNKFKSKVNKNKYYIQQKQYYLVIIYNHIY